MTAGNYNIPEKVQVVRTALENGWNEVVKLYETDHEAHTTKISSSGYTALHVAVAEGKIDIVEKLVESIREREDQLTKEELEKSLSEKKEQVNSIIDIEPVADDKIDIVETPVESIRESQHQLTKDELEKSISEKKEKLLKSIEEKQKLMKCIREKEEQVKSISEKKEQAKSTREKEELVKSIRKEEEQVKCIKEMKKKQVKCIKEQVKCIKEMKKKQALSIRKEEEKVKSINNKKEEQGKSVKENYKPLQIQNQYGNTPLHLAASMGNVRMCQIIIEDEVNVDQLLKIENEEGETPIFLPALHGKMDVFLYLSSVLQETIQIREEAIRTCRRDNGDTILHSAINGEYFDLAYKIIRHYPEMADAVNDEGKTPLQILATKPSAFRSASKFGLWKRIIYTCIPVQDLKNDSKSDNTSPESLNKDGDHRKQLPMDKIPENYSTLIGCYFILRKLVRLVVTKDPAKDFCGDEESAKGKQSNKTLFPENYTVLYDFLKLLLSALLVLTGQGYGWMIKMQKLKEKHIWSVQVLDELLEHNTKYDYEDAGASPYLANYQDDEGFHKAYKEIEKEHDNIDQKTESRGKRETALLIASRNGIIEMIKRILKKFPMAIYDTNKDGKNIVLVALETRQVEVFKLIMKTHAENESVFRKVDNDGNGALHIAAMGGEKPVSWPIPDDALQLKWKILPNKTHADNTQSIPSKEDNKDNGALHIAAMKGDLQKQHRWPIPGDALQLQWEIKWFKFVESAKPENFFVRYNKNGETPEEIFTKDHQKLVESGGEWMTKTAESCSVIAALIATVAFATSATLPGGTHEGKPVFAKQPAFQVFAVMSLVALSFSVTSLVMFLAILTSRFTQKDFDKVLPWKLLLGLTSLFVSIATILVSFCAGHFFVLKDSVEVAAFPVYAFTCIPISFFAAAQFPLYIDLIRATFGNPFAINEEISITLSNRYV